jgi:hypothetical protein
MRGVEPAVMEDLHSAVPCPSLTVQKRSHRRRTPWAGPNDLAANPNLSQSNMKVSVSLSPTMLRKRFQSWRWSLAQGSRLELATAHELEEPPRAFGPEVALPDLELGVIRSCLPHSDKPHAVVSLSKKKRVSNLMSGKKFDQGWSFGRAGDGCYVQLGRY